MKKLKFESRFAKFGREHGYSMIYLTPTILITSKNSEYDEIHHLTFEFHFIIFGFGLHFSWKNKNVKPPVDLSFLNED